MDKDLKLLVDEIARATEKSFLNLFQNKEIYYYCALVTTGEAVAPVISAWSWEALENVAKKYSKEDVELIKWSYADSPYWNFGCENFETVRTLFNERLLDYTDENKWFKEIDFRLEAMVLAMEKIGSSPKVVGDKISGLFLNVNEGKNGLHFDSQNHVF